MDPCLPSSSSSRSWRRFRRTFSSMTSSRLIFKLPLSNSWFFIIAIFFFKCLTRVSLSCFVPTMTPLITLRILQNRAKTINAEIQSLKSTCVFCFQLKVELWMELNMVDTLLTFNSYSTKYGPYDMVHIIWTILRWVNLQIAWCTIWSKKRTMSKDQATMTFNWIYNNLLSFYESLSSRNEEPNL